MSLWASRTESRVRGRPEKDVIFGPFPFSRYLEILGSEERKERMDGKELSWRVGGKRLRVVASNSQSFREGRGERDRVIIDGDWRAMAG